MFKQGLSSLDTGYLGHGDLLLIVIIIWSKVGISI